MILGSVVGDIAGILVEIVGELLGYRPFIVGVMVGKLLGLNVGSSVVIYRIRVGLFADVRVRYECLMVGLYMMAYVYDMSVLLLGYVGLNVADLLGKNDGLYDGYIDGFILPNIEGYNIEGYMFIHSDHWCSKSNYKSDS